MAGLKLKSGADFCNLEAFRMRLHNKGEDPTSDFGVGQIYFNTSDTSVGSARHVRLYDGTNFRSLAYLDEIAKNEEFLALKDRVDLLSGDVDTDAIISNMKEVSAFLEGFEEDASLMDYLNTELGKKLDLTGGTLTGDITTKSFWSGTDGSGLYIEGRSTVGVRIQYNKSETGNDYDRLLLKNGVISWNNKPLLHSGNVGEYAMKVNPSNINLASDTNVAGYGQTADGWPVAGPALLLSNIDGRYAMMLSGRNGVLRFNTRENGTLSDWKTIAFTDSNVASAQALAHSNGTVGAEANQWGGIDTSNTLRFLARDGESQAGYIGRASSTSDDVYLLSNNALRFFVGANATQAMLINSSGNVTIGGSDLAQEYYKLAVGGSTYLLASKGTSEQPSLGNIGTGTHVLIGTDSYGLEMWSRSNGNFGMQVHRFDGTATAYNLNLQPLGGNVLIGTTTDDGSGAKLQVAGAVTMASTLSVEGQTTLSSLTFSSANTISIDGNGNIKLSAKSGTYWNVATPNGINALTCYYNGNVGIGTTDPQEKLDIEGGIRVNGHIYPKWGNNVDLGKNAQRWNNIFAVKASFTEDVIIDGDLHVKGNIIADGEVSAGGAAEEGGNAGSGAGAFYSDIIKKGATQTTIAHGLGTDDIVVSIYEKDGVSGRWSIILTDVEIVDANNIIVSFGSATSVEHKVVIMGAVA